MAAYIESVVYHADYKAHCCPVRIQVLRFVIAAVGAEKALTGVLPSSLCSLPGDEIVLWEDPNNSRTLVVRAAASQCEKDERYSRRFQADHALGLEYANRCGIQNIVEENWLW